MRQLSQGRPLPYRQAHPVSTILSQAQRLQGCTGAEQQQPLGYPATPMRALDKSAQTCTRLLLWRLHRLPLDQRPAETLESKPCVTPDTLRLQQVIQQLLLNGFRLGPTGQND